MEAGLVVCELLLSRRIHLIVISPPPAMLVQWKERSLEQIRSIARRIGELRRRRGFSVNPWTTGWRFLIAHSLLLNRGCATSLVKISTLESR